MEFTITAFAIAAVCFLVSAWAATVFGVGIFPSADQNIAMCIYLQTVQFFMNICILSGSVGLLTGIAISRWLRSQTTGHLTTTVGNVGFAAMLWLVFVSADQIICLEPKRSDFL